MSKRNGKKKVQITAHIEQNVDEWLDYTVGDIGSKAAQINKILKQAMLNDKQYCIDNNIAQEGD